MQLKCSAENSRNLLEHREFLFYRAHWLCSRLKTLQRQLEFLEIQEEYIKEEQKNLKRELLRAQEEVKRIQSVPLVIGQFLEMVDANSGIVGSTTGSNYYVRILSTLNRELLKPSSSVALHRHSNALVDILPPEADSSISLLGDHEKPDVTYQVSCTSCIALRKQVPACRHFDMLCTGRSGGVHARFGRCLRTRQRRTEQHAVILLTNFSGICLAHRDMSLLPCSDCSLKVPECCAESLYPITFVCAGHWRLRCPEAGDSRGCGAAAHACRAVPTAGHRPPSGCAPVRAPGHWQDHARKGSGAPHHRFFHPCRRL